MSQKPITYVTVDHSMVAITQDGTGLRFTFAEVQVPEDKVPSESKAPPADAYDERGREVRFDSFVPPTRSRYI